jgi:hypothetical protein
MMQRWAADFIDELASENAPGIVPKIESEFQY